MIRQRFGRRRRVAGNRKSTTELKPSRPGRVAVSVVAGNRKSTTELKRVCRGGVADRRHCRREQKIHNGIETSHRTGWPCQRRRREQKIHNGIETSVVLSMDGQEAVAGNRKSTTELKRIWLLEKSISNFGRREQKIHNGIETCWLNRNQCRLSKVAGNRKSTTELKHACLAQHTPRFGGSQGTENPQRN